MPILTASSTEATNYVIIYTHCNSCLRPVAFMIYIRPNEINFAKILKSDNDFSTLDAIEIEEQWPTPAVSTTPDFLPAPVLRSLKQAKTNSNLPDHEEMAATAYRLTLERSLKIKFPDVGGMLNERIKTLRGNHSLPPDLCDWADQIKLEGNNAVHEIESLDKLDIQALGDFTDMVLRYLFTLPGLLEERKKHLLQQKDNSS